MDTEMFLDCMPLTLLLVFGVIWLAYSAVKELARRRKRD